jgi:acetyl esterase/lipase
MKRIFWLRWLPIVLLVVACAAQPTPTPLPTRTSIAPTPTLAPTPRATRTNTPLPTPTPEPATAVPTDTPMPTATPAATATVPPAVYDYEIVRDTPYQTDGSDYAQARCKLDLYLPQDRESFPVLVWFHGGALMFQSKREIYATSVAKRFASLGIGVALPNYRLSPRVKYPAYIEDAASAVAWVHNNVASHGGNPEQLFVGGHSSGAYLAAMVVMDKRYLELHQLSSQQIAGVIPLSGQMYGDSTVCGEHGIDAADKTIDETTPMFYVRRDVPPFLCMCAEYEDPPEMVCKENQAFIEALEATGHQNVTFQQIPGRSHLTVSEMSSPDSPAAKLMLTFIQKVISGQ